MVVQSTDQDDGMIHNKEPDGAGCARSVENSVQNLDAVTIVSDPSGTYEPTENEEIVVIIPENPMEPSRFAFWT